MPQPASSSIRAAMRALRRFGLRLGQSARPGFSAWFTAAPEPAAARLLHAADWAEIAALLRQPASASQSARSARRRNPGEGRSVFAGRGMDYAESRIYQAGDDLRGMHWQLLARTGKPHVKLHHEEHAGHWHGLVDARGTMLFGTRVRTKAQQAARAVLLAAGLQARESPQTSIACTLWRADGLHSRNFGRGMVAVRRLAAWLLAEPLPQPSLRPVAHTGPQATPHSASMPAAASPAASRLSSRLNRTVAGVAAHRADTLVQARADFIAWAQRLRAHQPGPSLLVLGSDWVWADAATDAALWSLAANADLLALQLRDPAELEWPVLPQSWFVDLQTGAAGWVDAGPAQRQAHAAHATQADAARTRALRASGARVGALSTADAAAFCLRVIQAAAASRVGALLPPGPLRQQPGPGIAAASAVSGSGDQDGVLAQPQRHPQAQRAHAADKRPYRP
jgi:hypothetical protein